MSENEDLLNVEDSFLYNEKENPPNNESEPSPGCYVSIDSFSFKDFQLKPPLLKALVDCGFKHPHKVQRLLLPQAMLGMPILYQGPGKGKKTVFVLATLQQLDPVDNKVSVLVLCHTTELALEILKEYERFSKYMPTVKVGVFIEGITIANDEKLLKTNCPHIVVGIPDRILFLLKNKKFNLSKLKICVIYDKCDKMFQALDLRLIYDIFKSMPEKKQVMVFCASRNPEIRPICKKLMKNKRRSKPEAAPEVKITNSASGSGSRCLLDCDELKQSYPTLLIDSLATKDFFKLNSSTSKISEKNSKIITKKPPKKGYKRYLSDTDSNSDSD